MRARVKARWSLGCAASLLGLAMAMGVSGCDPDPGPDCAATYRHLLELARRNDEPGLMARFLDACAASYDPARLACIREASTPGAALSCKPVKKRPG